MKPMQPSRLIWLKLLSRKRHQTKLKKLWTKRKLSNLMDLTQIREAARSVFEGNDPDQVAESLLAEARPQGTLGYSVETLASGALLAGSVWSLLKTAAQTGDMSIAGRAVNAIVGHALVGASNILSAKV